MSKVFRDWVRLMLYSLQRRNEPYLEVMERYPNDRDKGEREADLFSEAFAELMNQTQKYNTEMLGDCYMEIAGKYSVQGMGQFFTPQPVCDMMAQMTIPDTDEESPSVADPACGSGRLLHSAAKLLPTTAHFTGIDLDSICAHMATLNLCFFNMNGVIIHGNAITMEYYTGWIIKRTAMGGAIREMTEQEVEEYRELRGEELKAETKRRQAKEQRSQESQLALF